MWAYCVPDLQERKLTERQVQILRLVAAGLSNRQIGQRLGIVTKTVENHLYRAFNAMALAHRTRTEAVMKAIRMGLL